MRFLRIAAAAPLTLALGCSKKSSDTILVGHVASLTGSEATFGVSTDNGIKLAFEEMNKAGGVKGKKLALKTLDDQGKPEEAQVAATRLIVNDKVTILHRRGGVQPLAGHGAGGRRPQGADDLHGVHQPQGHARSAGQHPQVRVPGVLHRSVPGHGDGQVRPREHEDLEGGGAPRRGNAYSVGLADFFAETFKKMGGEIVTDQSFKAGDQDFKAQLTKIRETNPEAIYVPGLLHRRGPDLAPGPRAGDEGAH